MSADSLRKSLAFSVEFVRKMELQQEHSVSLNVYETQEETKSEDVDQTPPTGISRKVSGKKITVPLLIINILLLTIILLVMGIHYDHFRRSRDEAVMNAKKTEQEMWYLHDDTFYLFWSNQSDCDAAYRFCQERRADLATVTANNRDWLLSKINKKRLLVKKRNDADILMAKCTIFSESSELSEQAEGWVCAAVFRIFDDDGGSSSGESEILEN